MVKAHVGHIGWGSTGKTASPRAAEQRERSRRARSGLGVLEASEDFQRAFLVDTDADERPVAGVDRPEAPVFLNRHTAAPLGRRLLARVPELVDQCRRRAAGGNGCHAGGDCLLQYPRLAEEFLQESELPGGGRFPHDARGVSGTGVRCRRVVSEYPGAPPGPGALPRPRRCRSRTAPYPRKPSARPTATVSAFSRGLRFVHASAAEKDAGMGGDRPQQRRGHGRPAHELPGVRFDLERRLHDRG